MGVRGTAEWLTRSSLVSQALARVLRVHVTYIRCGIAIACMLKRSAPKRASLRGDRVGMWVTPRNPRI